MTTISVQSGDVTTVASDALITAINPGGMWFGGVDRAIMRSAGSRFHDIAMRSMPLTDGQIVHATAPVIVPNDCMPPVLTVFRSVLFVIDSLQRPLDELILPVFQEADRLGLRTLSMPMMRTGVMAGVYETPREAVYKVASAVNQFVASRPRFVEEIKVVVFGQPQLANELESAVTSGTNM